MKVYKNGNVVFNSIDNTGSTNEASLGARYAKARLDSTDNNLTLNYYKKEQVETLIEQALSDANLLKAMVVRSVPPVDTASQNIIYLVRVSDDEDIYQQYKKVLVSRNPDEYTMALLGSTEVKMENIQVTSLPKASISIANKVLQYIGDSGAYVKGRFYLCASKTYYAWDYVDGAEAGGDITPAATYYVEKSQPEVSDDVYSGSFILDEFVPEKFSKVEEVREDQTGKFSMVDTLGFTYERNSENDITTYRWIPILSKLSEFQNDGDGTSPFVTQQELDDLIADANKIFYAKRDVTTSSEIEAAIRAGKMIQITNTATSSLTVVHSYVGSGYVDLYSVEYDTDKTDVITSFRRYRVAGSVWTTTLAELGAFVATVDSTTELELKEAIGERREILITTGSDQHYAVVYAEDKGTDGAYVVCTGIVTDTARWNRKRSRFTAYTVLGNVWTAADPIDAVLAEDLTNIVTSLPSTGVANTRYLLKVTDASTVGYHLDEYIYTDGKWVYISKEQPAPFIATIKVTSQAEIMAAVNSGSPIYIYSDITGTLWPAISAVANAFTATVRYLTVGSSSGNYNVDIVSYSVVGKTWTPTTIGIALKSDLEKYVPKLATPIAESTTDYIRAFKMNADGLITGTSGSYSKSDTISSSNTTSQLPSAKAVRDYVATPSEVKLTYNTTYIEANYSKCYKVAEKIYMCNIAFQAKSSNIPANTWLIRFPENIVSSGVEVYCVMHCTDRVNVPATLLLQMGGSASFNQFFVKTNPFTGNKYYFGNVMIIKTA